MRVNLNNTGKDETLLISVGNLDLCSKSKRTQDGNKNQKITGKTDT